MKTIAIISQKGGAGKTTIAVHLAVQAAKEGKSVIVLDLDPQASAMSWKDVRAEDTPEVTSIQPARLNVILNSLKKANADFVILDTAPHSENAALLAAQAADVILAPCRPAFLDLKAIESTANLMKLAGKKGIAVLNCVPSRGAAAADESTAVLTQFGFEVAPVQLGNRAAYIHSLAAGLTAQEYEPNGKATDEIKALYSYICITI